LIWRRHFPLDRISRFCAESWSVKPGERAELTLHLSTGCRRCWSAVAELAPGSVGTSCDPVAEALYHVTMPQSRAVLMADHLAAVEAVRRRPFGFAFVFMAEAFLIAWDGKTPIPLEGDAFKLIGRLRPGRHDHQHLDDLYAVALAYVSMVQTLCDRLDAAGKARDLAEGHRHMGTGDERVGATLLDARALLAAAEGDPQAAEALLTAALQRLAAKPHHNLRRFELYGRLADVLIGAGELGRVPGILARANQLLEGDRLSGDPLCQARAIYKRAMLTAYLAARLEQRHCLLESALRWALDELEAAGELFAAATNTTTQTLRLLCLSRLYSFFDAERAAQLHRQAINRIQPEGRTFFSFPVPVDVTELERAFPALVKVET